MTSNAIIHPTWPLGLRFIDSKGRTFEVIKVIMGYPEFSNSYEVECQNGWVIASELGEHAQSRAGFVDIENRDLLIVELVDKLDQFIINGHLKRI